MPGKLNMQSIEMKVTLSGKKSSVRLECTLYWRDPDILGTSQLQLMGKVDCFGFFIQSERFKFQ